jgi:hypothetical protein
MLGRMGEREHRARFQCGRWAERSVGDCEMGRVDQGACAAWHSWQGQLSLRASVNPLFPSFLTVVFFYFFLFGVDLMLGLL